MKERFNVLQNGEHKELIGDMIRYHSGTGKKVAGCHYKNEEQSMFEVDHVSNDNSFYWLKSYGLTSWAIVV